MESMSQVEVDCAGHRKEISFKYLLETRPAGCGRGIGVALYSGGKLGGGAVTLTISIATSTEMRSVFELLDC